MRAHNVWSQKVGVVKVKLLLLLLFSVRAGLIKTGGTLHFLRNGRR